MKTNTLKRTKSLLLLVVILTISTTFVNANSVYLYQASSLSVELSSTNETCKARGDIKVDIIGGVAPYTVNVKNRTTKVVKSIETSITSFKFSALGGRYDVNIVDSNGLEDTKTISVRPYIIASLDASTSCVIGEPRKIVIPINTSFPGHFKVYDVSSEPKKQIHLTNFSGRGIYKAPVPARVPILIEISTINGCESSQYAIAPECKATDVTTDLDSPESSVNEVAMYPNPTYGVLFFDKAISGKKSVSIYNSLGEMVMKSIITENQLNISDLSDGMYFVNIIANGKKYTQKVIKK